MNIENHKNIDRVNTVFKKLANASISAQQAMINFSKIAGLMHKKNKLNAKLIRRFKRNKWS